MTTLSKLFVFSLLLIFKKNTNWQIMVLSSCLHTYWVKPLLTQHPQVDMAFAIWHMATLNHKGTVMSLPSIPVDGISQPQSAPAFTWSTFIPQTCLVASITMSYILSYRFLSPSPKLPENWYHQDIHKQWSDRQVWEPDFRVWSPGWSSTGS